MHVVCDSITYAEHISTRTYINAPTGKLLHTTGVGLAENPADESSQSVVCTTPPLLMRRIVPMSIVPMSVMPMSVMPMSVMPRSSAARGDESETTRDIAARADEDHVDESCVDKSRARKPAHTTRTGQLMLQTT